MTFKSSAALACAAILSLSTSAFANVGTNAAKTVDEAKGPVASGMTTAERKADSADQSVTDSMDHSQDAITGERAGIAKKDSNKASTSEMRNAMALNQLHHINQKEIKLSQMAQDKAQSPELKANAEKILKDHKDLEAKVEDLAKTENVKLESFQPSTIEKTAMNQLDKLEGSQFDQAFMKYSQQSNRDSSRKLRMASNQTSDPKIKDAINTMIPKIKEHARMSKNMKIKPQAAGSTDTSDSSDTTQW